MGVHYHLINYRTISSISHDVDIRKIPARVESPQSLGVKTLFIEPGSPWENGYIESFNGKMRDELLNREVFDTLLEAQVLVEAWRMEYNRVRPHSSLG